VLPHKQKHSGVESEISNPLGAIKDGVTSTITIQTDAILSHKISPSNS